MVDQMHPVILDNGSYMCKAGFAGDDSPASEFPPVVGLKQNSATTEGVDRKDCFIGGRALFRRNLHHKYPMKDGEVTDWDCMVKIWQHAFHDELRVSPEEHSVLLIERPLTSKANRERSVQRMFEEVNIGAMYLGNSALLSLYAAGRSTGTVIDMGHSCTHIVPISDSHPLQHAISKVDVGGMDLNTYLTRILAEDGYSFDTPEDRDTIRAIREKLCYVARDYGEELKIAAIGTDYELPDGNVIAVRNQRFRCPELLFQPDLYGKKSPGLHTSAFNSIMKCESSIRKDLFRTIVLSGGSSMVLGIEDRVEREIRAPAPSSMSIKIIAPPKRIYSPWIGGSILASQSGFQNMLISKEEYYEEGPDIVHRKCN